MHLDLIRIFVKVAQNQSFSKAADILKLPKSTVSKSVTRLEKETGTKLLVRTTRSLAMTAAGRLFYESSLGPIQILEDAQKSLYGQDTIVSGLVRITAPEDLGSTVIAPIIADLTLKHPKLSFELHYTEEVIDLVKDGFDLAVRIGRLNESRFKVKKAGEVVLIAVATPKYLKDKGKITRPKDLEKYDCLTYSDQSFQNRLTLRSSKGTEHVKLKSRVSSNLMSSLRETCLNHGGIAFIPSYLCDSAIRKGDLVRLLPDWTSPGLPVSIITPLTTTSSARLKITAHEVLTSVRKALGYRGLVAQLP